MSMGHYLPIRLDNGKNNYANKKSITINHGKDISFKSVLNVLSVIAISSGDKHAYIYKNFLKCLGQFLKTVLRDKNFSLFVIYLIGKHLY